MMQSAFHWISETAGSFTPQNSRNHINWALKKERIEKTEKQKWLGLARTSLSGLLSALVSLSSPHFIANEQAYKKSLFDFSLLLSIASSLGASLEDIRVYHLLGWAAVSDLQISFYIKDPFR